MSSLPARTPFIVRLGSSFDARSWRLIGLFAAFALIAVPVMHLVLPADHPLHLSTWFITLVGKILCYAIVAVAMDLIWGYGGILSLGHGLFFALGGYGFGMYLMRQIGRDGSYQSDLPDFMVFLDWKELPWFWIGSDSFLWAVLLVLVVPALIAFVFGYFAFRSRIKGVYFSIITQALTYAAMLLFFRNETGFGGNNGFTDFKRILGYPITAPETRVVSLRAVGAGADRHPVAGALPRALEVRPRPDGDPRRRVAGHVHRLQPAVVQALRMDAVGGPLRHRRGALRAAGGNHQSVGDVGRQLDRDRHLGCGRWPWNADRAGDRRLPGQSCEELVHRQLPRVLAVLPRHTVHRRHPLPAAGCGRPLAAAARPPAGHGQGCRRAGRGGGERSGRMNAVDLPPTNGDNPDWDSGTAELGHILKPGQLDLSHKVILYLEDITVSFDGFRALNKLSLTIDAGELRCIIGPNGAGKTTMMDVITGKTRPDEGTVFFGQTIDLTGSPNPRSPTTASVASSRSRRSSRTTRCSRISSWR
jgi:hypothetical protein